ncbi:MAG: ABC transporter ATP-binding protein [Clostridia bacterium]|nr:ABC transporter ATP-binding protein [Clostridia bacterium]
MKVNEKRLFDRVVSWGFSHEESTVISIFAYNLPTDSAEKVLDGIVLVTRERFYQYEDKTCVRELALDDIKEFRLIQGVGCVMAEYEAKTGEHVLFCRADNKHEASIGVNLKMLNHYFSYGDSALGKSNYKSKTCPKCGRPLRGSSTCPRCASKSKLLGKLWNVAKPYKNYIIFSVLMYFAISAIRLLLPLLDKILVDDYINSEAAVKLPDFLVVILAIAITNLLVNAFSMLRGWFLIVAGNKVILRLRQMVFDKIQAMSISSISQRTSGELMQRVTSDTAVIRNFITNQLPGLAEQIIVFVVACIALFIYKWELAILVIFPAPFVILSFRLFWTSMHRRFRKRWRRESESSATLHDIFSGIRVVKSYGTEKREADRYEKATSEEKKAQLDVEFRWAYIMPVLEFFMGIGEFVLLYYVGNQILNADMSFGDMAMFSSYVALIYGPLRNFASLPRQLLRTTTSASKVFEIIDEKEDVADAVDSKELKIQGKIELKDISFGYDEATEVLRNINFSIEPGDFIGIVGHSGAGKSTLINLIMRMYDVDEGQILIDGVDIREIAQESLRSQMGIVLQETFLFSGSVFQNIAYAKQNATMEEVVEAAKTAGAHKFIMSLPDGYNTKVGERGSTLSGGERQRIAIARALLHDPKILILDEATAALDTETEKQIQEAIQRLASQRTTIAIAHRLSTLRNATKLIVLDHGKLVESGTHDELMAKEGIYHGLVMAQRVMSQMQTDDD